MTDTTIKDILEIRFADYLDSTAYTSYTESEKRQIVTAALLELYKAEALGGGVNHSVHNNLSRLPEHIETVMSVLEAKD
ncbi:hypothetical protein [Shewanella baltica]|uniref:hypothetical protein n=1 Tax=Shewanella baltica TaxID=62322 RepID=UPI003D7A6951